MKSFRTALVLIALAIVPSAVIAQGPPIKCAVGCVYYT